MTGVPNNVTREKVGGGLSRKTGLIFAFKTDETTDRSRTTVWTVDRQKVEDNNNKYGWVNERNTD